MDWRVVTLLCVLCFNLSGASTCAPNSKFKIDCNICLCTASGKEYSCSNYVCPPRDYNQQYYNSETKDGHILLVPKYSDQFKPNDDEFILPTKIRKVRIPDGYPYINDEMTSKAIKDVDNSKEFDAEVMKPKRESEWPDIIENKREAYYQNRAENNDINTDRWSPFKPRKVPDYPE